MRKSSAPPSVEELMVLGFKKMSERKEREKDLARRAEVAEKFKQRQLEEEDKRKRHDRLIYAALLVFLFCIGTVIYNAKQNGYFASASDEAAAGGASAEVDCQLSGNYALPICVEDRKAKIDAQWKSMMFNKDGKEKAFSVHGNRNE